MPIPQKAAWLVPVHWELAGAEGASELTASSQMTSVGRDQGLRLDCSYLKRVILETRQLMAPPSTAGPACSKALSLLHLDSSTLVICAEPLTPLLEV